jgi:protein-tyrosine phosphatase
MRVPVRVVFVCLGNICRSPTAEGVFRHLVARAGLDDAFEIDSAGTSAHHVGETPDRRATAEAKSRGVVLAGASRQFIAADFEDFDYVVAMDASNARNMLGLAGSDEERDKLSLLRDWDADSPTGSEVPDPYYGGDDGFREVFDVVMAGSAGLLSHIRSKRGL